MVDFKLKTIVGGMYFEMDVYYRKIQYGNNVNNFVLAISCGMNLRWSHEISWIAKFSHFITYDISEKEGHKLWNFRISYTAFFEMIIAYINTVTLRFIKKW